MRDPSQLLKILLFHVPINQDIDADYPNYTIVDGKDNADGLVS